MNQSYILYMGCTVKHDIIIFMLAVYIGVPWMKFIDITSMSTIKHRFSLKYNQADNVAGMPVVGGTYKERKTNDKDK